MVLKKSKFGGNTGNTLRKSYKGGYRVNPTAAYISKDSYDTFELVDDSKSYRNEWMKNGIKSKKSKNSLNTCNNVLYSLNKRKMWDISEKMQMEVLAESERNHIEDDTENDVRVAIIDNVSFINSVDRKENRNTKAWDADLNISREFEDTVDTTYKIDKAVDYKTWPYHTDWTESDKHHKKTLRKKIHEKFTFIDDDIDNDISDEDSEIDVFCDEKPFTPSKFDLDMFMVKKIAKKRKCSNHSAKLVGSKNCIKNNGKQNVFIIDNPDIPTNTDTVTDEKEKEIKVEIDEKVGKNSLALLFNDAHMVKEFDSLVDDKQITSETLKKRFNAQYIEGISTARQFVIFNNRFSCNEVIMSVKVLSQDTHSPAEKISQIHIRLFNVSDGFSECLDGILQQDILDFELLSDMCFPRSHDIIKITSSKAVIQNELVQKSIKPFAELKSMNDICQDVLSKSYSTQDSVSSDQNLFSDTKCLICFTDEITTSLKKCYHPVCESCWSRYIDTKFMSGCYEISCPYTNCKNKLDIVLILNFIDNNYAIKYIEKCCELYVQKNEHLKFCPSGLCSMVAVKKTDNSLKQIDKTALSLENNPSVLCPCKQRWCFSCEEPEHWPSSCAANKAYQLEKRKDYDLLFDNRGHLNETSVLCRQCPACGNHIIKNEGCNHMSCRCGKTFCWACLKLWSKHNPCIPVEDQVYTFSSADMFYGSRKLRMKGKALSFSSQVKKVGVLKTKLKITKIYSKDERSNLLTTNVYKSFLLLSSGYRLLENLAVSAAMCKSRHGGGRISRFINDFSFNLKVLYDKLDKSKLAEIKIGDLMKEIRNIELSFTKLNGLGIINDKKLSC